MKKKLILLGVLVVSFLFCVVGVKAATIKYQVYEQGETVSEFPKADGIGYTQVHVEYIVTEDDGEDDNEVRVTNVNDDSDTFLIDKRQLAGYSLIKSNKSFEKEETDIYKLHLIDGVSTVKFYKTKPNILREIVGESDEFDKIAVIRMPGMVVFDVSDNELVIPKNVTVYAIGETELAINNFVINGIVKVDTLYAHSLSGNGKLVLQYRYPTGHDDSDDDRDPRLFVYEITSNNFNIELEYTDIREGMTIAQLYDPFNHNDLNENLSISAANKLNKNAVQFSGYKFGTKTVTKDNNEEYYVILEKDDSNNSSNSTTTEVKNPKTSDSIMNIIAIMALVGAGTFFTIKKVKNN